MVKRRRMWTQYAKTVSCQWSSTPMFKSVTRYLHALGYAQELKHDYMACVLQRGEARVKTVRSITDPMQWTSKVAIKIYKIYLADEHVCEAVWQVYTPAKHPPPRYDYWQAEMQGLDDVGQSGTDEAHERAISRVKQIAKQVNW